MINRRTVWGASLAVAIGLTAVPASAALVEVDFSFGTVSGTFFGLDNSITTVQSARSYDFIGALDSYFNVNPLASSLNGFSFRDGVLTSVIFDDLPFVTGSGLTGFLVELFCDDSFSCRTTEERRLPDAGGAGFVFTSGAATFEVRELSPIPLPAGGLLLLTGLAAAAGLGYRKKRAA